MENLDILTKKLVDKYVLHFKELVAGSHRQYCDSVTKKTSDLVWVSSLQKWVLLYIRPRVPCWRADKFTISTA